MEKHSNRGAVPGQHSVVDADAEVLALIAAAQPRVRAYVSRVARDADEVEDLMAETTARAWLARGEVVRSTEPGAAIISHARVACRNWVRSHRHEVPLDSKDFSDLTGVAVTATMSVNQAVLYREWMARVLSRLPAGYRTAVELRCCRSLAYGVIAAALACSEGAARVRVSRGLHRLLAIVANDPPPPPETSDD